MKNLYNLKIIFILFLVFTVFTYFKDSHGIIITQLKILAYLA